MCVCVCVLGWGGWGPLGAGCDLSPCAHRVDRGLSSLNRAPAPVFSAAVLRPPQRGTALYSTDVRAEEHADITHPHVCVCVPEINEKKAVHVWN